MTDSTLGSPNNKVILNQFVPAALELLQDLPEQDGLTTIGTANGKKVYYYSTKSTKNDAYSRPAWAKLNRLRICVGVFLAALHKWEIASAPTYECGVIRNNRLTTAKHLLPSTHSFWNNTPWWLSFGTALKRNAKAWFSQKMLPQDA